LFVLGFTGLQAQTVKDIDGNVYKTITIGTQVWMAENLKTTKYNDGTAIPLVADDKAWAALTTPALCWYNNEETANKNKYGALYNWYTVSINKLCPKGWHVPTVKEWTILTTYLGGKNASGGKLKETGLTHWKSSNKGVTNETGFTALPSGSRNQYGVFYGIGYSGNWWSSSEYSTTSAYFRYVNYRYINVGRLSYRKRAGFSVRCLRDL
jgi:uncharacterized protein (TIGR02145 family)